MFLHKKTFYVDKSTILEELVLSYSLSHYITLSCKTYVLGIDNGSFCIIDLSRFLKYYYPTDTSIDIETYLNQFTYAIRQGFYTNDIPKKNPETNKYENRIDAFDALQIKDLKIDYTSLSSPDIRSDPSKRFDCNDLVISGFENPPLNMLAAINGLFHRAFPFQGELYILGGFHSIKNSGLTNIALYDTSTVGGHEIIPIVPSMLGNSSLQSITRGAYLNIPKTFSLKDKTVFVIIDGQLLNYESTEYIITGPNSLKVNINQLDMIDLFLHSPNTIYLHDYVQDIDESSLDGLRYRGIFDLMSYYIKRIYPFLGDTAVTDLTQDFETPLVREFMRYYFTSIYPLDDRPRDKITAHTDMDFIKYTNLVTNITRLIDYTKLTSEDFIYSHLFSSMSFIVLINNNQLYRRIYNPIAWAGQGQYMKMDKDTPRGFLRFNKQKTFPYVQRSAIDGQHILSLGYADQRLRIYKSILDPLVIPSPLFDLVSAMVSPSVEMIEFYSK